MTDDQPTDGRGDIIDALVDRLRQHPSLAGPDVSVEPEYPGDQIKPRALWLWDVPGESVEIPVAVGAGRQVRDDHFQLVWRVQVADRGDYYETRRTATAIVAALEDVVADDPSLGDEPGGLLSIEMVNKDGPMCIRTDKGRIGRAEVTYSVHARYW